MGASPTGMSACPSIAQWSAAVSGWLFRKMSTLLCAVVALDWLDLGCLACILFRIESDIPAACHIASVSMLMLPLLLLYHFLSSRLPWWLETKRHKVVCVCFQSEFGRLDLKKGQNPGGFLTHLLTVTPANFDSKQCSILQQFAGSVTSDLRPGYLLARP